MDARAIRGADAQRAHAVRGTYVHRRRRPDHRPRRDRVSGWRVPGGAGPRTVHSRGAGRMRISGGTVLSMRPGDAPAVRDLFIDGDRIAEHADGEVIDASGCYVMPGLVQTHIHLVQT